MQLAAIGVDSRALWYLTRGTGLVAMILLTVALVLGITQAVRFARPGLPRLVISGLHRNASLVATVLLVVHIVTAVADTYAPIRVADVFVPFVGTYRAVWLGLGALAFDLMLAVVASSLIRDRIGLRTWRTVHWTAYASWPIAVAHGIGTGSDTKLGWVLLVYAVCLAAVLGAMGWRLATGWSPANAVRRATVVLVAGATVLVVGVWTVAGPLRPGWARRAGTPVALLGGTRTAASTKATPPTAPSAAGLVLPFTAPFSGTVSDQGPDASGLVSVTITGQTAGATPGDLAVVLHGTPDQGGGVALSQSQVTFGPPGSPQEFTGSVSRLAGAEIVAALSGSDGAMVLDVDLNLASGSSRVTGTVQGRR